MVSVSLSVGVLLALVPEDSLEKNLFKLCCVAACAGFLLGGITDGFEACDQVRGTESKAHNLDRVPCTNGR